MSTLSDAAKLALEPWVGPMVADTCVRATALSLGVASTDLGSEQLPALESNIRRLLGPVAPAGAIDDIISDIRRKSVAGVL